MTKKTAGNVEPALKEETEPVGEAASFEQRLQQVQGIIAGIEAGDAPLEASVTQFETGMKMLNQLEAELREMGRKLTILQSGAQGQEEARWEVQDEEQ